jgi:REP element-mobilizing transposase RayT
LDTPGTLHHIIVRGIEGTLIFRQDLDREAFLSRLGELVYASGTRVLAWVLMNNHVHLLQFSGTKGISHFMRRLLTGYAIFYNRRYQRKGHLFQDRFKSIICDHDSYLEELIRYVHLNPLRAGVVKSILELDKYKWSGHGVLMGKTQREWQEKEYVLSHFGKTHGKAVRAYRKFIEEAKSQGRRPDLVGGGLIRSLGGWSRVMTLREQEDELSHDSRILGDPEFVRNILQEANQSLKRQMRMNERKEIIDRVIRKNCEEEGVQEGELRKGGQRWKISRLRTRIALQLRHDWGISMAEIARNVGVSTSGIANAIRKIETSEKNE